MVNYGSDNIKTVELPKDSGELAINLSTAKVHFKIMFYNITTMKALKLEQVQKYINVSAFYLDQEKDAEQPNITYYDLKPLKADNFPVMVLENGTNTPVVENCRSKDTHCYEFDHDDTINISRSIDG